MADDKELLRAVARAMFAAETEGSQDKDARKAAYKEAKSDMVKRARKLVRLLERRGVTMTVTAKAADASDDD